MVKRSCPICNSSRVQARVLSGPDRLHGAPGTFWIDVCKACGAGWTLPAASQHELWSLYRGSYHAYSGDTSLVGRVQGLVRQAILNRALTRPPFRAVAERGGGGGDLLDVGCGRGDLGAAFLRRGWRVSGIEPSEAACELAGARGLQVSTGTLSSVEIEERSFDAVVMNHSLEHVHDPSADLRRVFQALKPGGLVAISVPNFATWQRRRFGSAWFHLDLPRHRTHFTPKSLGVALSGAGLEVVSLGHASDSGSLLATAQYAVAGRLLLNGRASSWLGYALSLLLSPLTRALDRVAGQGPILHALARRPANGSIPPQAP